MGCGSRSPSWCLWWLHKCAVQSLERRCTAKCTCIWPCGCMSFAARCVARRSPGRRWTLLGVAMSLTQLPTRTRVHAAVGEPRQVASRPEPAARRPRMMRMPADWWDSPTVVGCPLSRGPQSARAARRLTRSTLRDWGLAFLSEDAEAIVGEFVANAVTHAAAVAALPKKQSAENLGLPLL